MNSEPRLIILSDTRKSISDTGRRVRRNWLSNQEIGDRVKGVRKALGGITQKELARRVGRPGSQSVISEIETTGREPDPGILDDIAALIGEGLEYFQVQEGEGESERREKLVAARWMERLAAQLRKEADPTPLPEDAGVPDAARAASRSAEVSRSGKQARKRGRAGG